MPVKESIGVVRVRMRRRIGNIYLNFYYKVYVKKQKQRMIISEDVRTKNKKDDHSALNLGSGLKEVYLF